MRQALDHLCTGKKLAVLLYASNNIGPGENLQAWGERAKVDVIWHRSAPSIQHCTL